MSGGGGGGGGGGGYREYVPGGGHLNASPRALEGILEVSPGSVSGGLDIEYLSRGDLIYCPLGVHLQYESSIAVYD